MRAVLILPDVACIRCIPYLFRPSPKVAMNRNVSMNVREMKNNITASGYAFCVCLFWLSGAF